MSVHTIAQNYKCQPNEGGKAGDSSSGAHECLCEVSWKSIQTLLRYAWLDHSGGPANQQMDIPIPKATLLAWLIKLLHTSATYKDLNVAHQFCC